MSLRSQKLLKNGAPLPGMGSAGSSLGGGVDNANRHQREELERIQQDVFLLSQRIAEVKGEPLPTRDTVLGSSVDAANSTFVSSLRALADAERRARDVKEQKVHALESLLEKVSEYNRLVLARTAPPEIQATENSNVPVRRKSFGSELSTLPSHLRVIDRLFDLHTQAKRVTVIRTSESQPTSARTQPTNNNEAELTQLRQKVTSQQQQIADATAQTKALESQLSDFQSNNAAFLKEISTLKSQHTEQLSEWSKQQKQLQTEIDKLKTENSSLSSSYSALNESYHKLQAERSAVNVATQQLREQLQQCQKQQQLEKDSQEKMLQQQQFQQQPSDTALLSLLKSHAQMLLQTDAPLSAIRLNDSDAASLTATQRDAILQLQSGLHSRLQSLQKEVALLLALKETLEGDVASANLQRDLLQQDFIGLQEQHDALRAAYHSQSFELATHQTNALKQFGSSAKEDISKNDTQEAEIKQLRQEMETQRDTILTLENSLQLQRMQLRTLEQWPQMVADLENKVEMAARDKLRLETQLTGITSELTETQRLVQSLRDRLRDVCQGSGSNSNANNNNPNWNDTYEEVMQEELQAMKAAFETKLKAMKDEAEALSKRHQQEILHIQQSSSQKNSFATLPALPNR